MQSSTARGAMSATIMLGLFLLGCGIDVREHEVDGRKEVDIRSPVGDISVRTDVGAPQTGLPTYPGSRLLHDGDDPATADVAVALPFVNVKVIATKFVHDDGPDAVRAFYKEAMRTYGDVVECRGEIDFKGRMGRSRPVCDAHRRSKDVQLAVGTEERHRLVVVKPRGTGSEFAVVYIQTDEG